MGTDAAYSFETLDPVYQIPGSRPQNHDMKLLRFHFVRYKNSPLCVICKIFDLGFCAVFLNLGFGCDKNYKIYYLDVAVIAVTNTTI